MKNAKFTIVYNNGTEEKKKFFDVDFDTPDDIYNQTISKLSSMVSKYNIDNLISATIVFDPPLKTNEL